MHRDSGHLNGITLIVDRMSRRKTSLIACLTAFFFFVPIAAEGQIPGGEENQIQVYGQPGNPKMNVYVWGQAQTGLWSVDVGTDLLEFASIITTSGMTANRADQETTLILQLFRAGRGGEPVFEKMIEDVFVSRSYPELNDGDILVLKERTRRRFTWRDVSQVLGTVTSTVSLVLLIERLQD